MDEKTKRILNHIQTISVLTDCIDIEYNSDLVDARFKDKALSNHNRRIKESVSQIKTSLSFRYKVKDREFMTYEHAVQVHRLFTYFSTMETSQLEELMDGFEKLK